MNWRNSLLFKTRTGYKGNCFNYFGKANASTKLTNQNNSTPVDALGSFVIGGKFIFRYTNWYLVA